MGKVLIFGLMVKNTLDNGLIIKCMEKDFWLIKIKTNTKVIFYMGRNMVVEFRQ
jgi:hypothetical protein